MGVYPLGFDMEPEVEAATLKFYLGLREGYIGSPMLSALYGVWAAYTGDRDLAAKLMEDGYGRFCVGRFMQTLEYREDVFPEQPRAGPFFANLGGFLLGLLTGFPGLQPGWGDVQGWARRPVTLPEGWTAIEVARIWVGGRPYKLVARQGAEVAQMMFSSAILERPSRWSDQALFSYAVTHARQWRNAEGAWTRLPTSLSMAAEIVSAESFLRVVNRCEPRCDTLKRAYLAEGYRPPRLNGNSAREIDRPEHFSFERQFVAGGDALRGHVTCDSVDNRL